MSLYKKILFKECKINQLFKHERKDAECAIFICMPMGMCSCLMGQSWDAFKIVSDIYNAEILFYFPCVNSDVLIDDELNYLMKKFNSSFEFESKKYEKNIIFGISLGSIFASSLAASSKKTNTRLILISPLVSITKDVFFSNFLIRKIVNQFIPNDVYNNENDLRKIKQKKIKTLIFIGKKDKILCKIHENVCAKIFDKDEIIYTDAGHNAVPAHYFSEQMIKLFDGIIL